MLKVYLAGPYSMKEEIREFAEQLWRVGVVVTSRWLEEEWPPDTQLHEVSDTEHAVSAKRDFEDITTANGMIFFSVSPQHPTVRGGRHVEFGLALAMHKWVWVIGPRENIFHYLQSVVHFPTKEECLLAAMQYCAY